ncbi:helix-turn-helix domain-containing protein [Evansella cellulosilytica]|uniref:Helix-turn-helix domain protein n=1 Tax=Evansella cellulosilytica (strain ATCC 21833 / DSM 2522 / FERM P-1141 / JCM 9156 / N-4) TaxID=649639 RepID=E6TVK4_EVAC2|nr:helix-turn-helix transcriptional regulator [Evansella cellulosilytica]ADU32132.1 helix-turn-helix domain protein [Evansella cellulosilytica DSM 2522]
MEKDKLEQMVKPLNGEKLRKLRKQTGKSIEEVAWLAGIHHNSLGAFERGEMDLSFTNIVLIAEALEIDMNLIVEDSQSMLKEFVKQQRRDSGK